MRAKAAGAERELREQEEAFCLAYARCWSVADAAREAGIEPATGYRWMRDPAIKWRTRELAREFAADVHVEVEQILRELTFLAHFDPADLFDDEGALLDLKALPVYARKAIKELKVEKTQTFIGEDANEVPETEVTKVIEVKLYSKEKALELLGKFKKLFGDEEQDGKKRVAITINAGPCPHCGKDRGT